jgi:hypothetical protein
MDSLGCRHNRGTREDHAVAGRRERREWWRTVGRIASIAVEQQQRGHVG